MNPQVLYWIVWVICLCVGVGIPHIPDTARFMDIMPAISILGFAASGYIAVFRTAGWWKSTIGIVLLSIFAIGIEILSITSGFPYSFFTYGSAIGLRIAGLVPWTVPFAWVPLVIAAYVLARNYTKKPAQIIAVGALFLVLIDACLDPIAVHLGYWKYVYPGVYFGVPWQNFAGWLLSGAIGLFGVGFIVRWKSLPIMATVGGGAILGFWSGACAGTELWLPAAMGVLSSVVLIASERRRDSLQRAAK